MYNNACRTARHVSSYNDLRQIYERASKVRGKGYGAHFCEKGEPVTGKHFIHKGGEEDAGTEHFDVIMHHSRLFRFWRDGRVEVAYTNWHRSPTTSAFRHAFPWPSGVRTLLDGGESFIYRVIDGLVHIDGTARELLPGLVAVGHVAHRPTIKALYHVDSLTRRLVGGTAREFENSNDSTVLTARALTSAQPWPGVVFGATL